MQILEQIERADAVRHIRHMLAACVTNKSASRVKESSHARRARAATAAALPLAAVLAQLVGLNAATLYVIARLLLATAAYPCTQLNRERKRKKKSTRLTTHLLLCVSAIAHCSLSYGNVRHVLIHTMIYN